MWTVTSCEFSFMVVQCFTQNRYANLYCQSHKFDKLAWSFIQLFYEKLAVMIFLDTICLNDVCIWSLYLSISGTDKSVEPSLLNTENTYVTVHIETSLKSETTKQSNELLNKVTLKSSFFHFYAFSLLTIIFLPWKHNFLVVFNIFVM